MINSFDEAFDSFKQKIINKKYSQEMSISQRDSFFNLAKSQGLPSRKLESWRYTSLKALSEKSWRIDGATIEEDFGTKLSQEMCQKLSSMLPDLGYKVCFLNGVLIPQLSDVSELKKFNLIQITEAFSNESEQPSDFQKKSGLEFFENLRRAFFTKSYLMSVLSKSKLDKPVVIAHFYSDKDQSYNQQILKILVEEGAEAQIFEMSISLDESNLFLNKKIKIDMYSGSKLELINLQKVNFNSTFVRQISINISDNANFNNFNLSFGARNSHQNIDVKIKGENSCANLFGIYCGQKNQQHDFITNIEHLVGGSKTNQFYKGLLDDKSKAVFSGRVFIAPQSQKAASEQLNNNLLLSNEAEVNSKPQLEIYADDVKATHGSTVGQISEEEIFYLKSRAISQDKAYKMLCKAFLSEVIENIEEDHLRRAALSELSGVVNEIQSQSEGKA